MDVNPTAVYKALENGGYDTELMLAAVYDEINGNTANMDTLLAKRAELGNMQDIIGQLVRDVGTLEEPVGFRDIGGEFDPASGVLKSDLVKRNWEYAGADPKLQIKDLAHNADRYITDNGNILLNIDEYVPQIPNRDFYTAGVADNPKIIARNFSPMGLKNALIDAISNNRKEVKLKFPNGNEISVRNEAIRDALQHQGYDINSVLDGVPGIKKGVRQAESLPLIDSVGAVQYFGSGINSAKYVDGVPHILESLEKRGFDEIIKYEIGTALGNEGQRSTFTGKIAKIEKNADGKFEVWIAKAEDNFAGEFTGTPDGVYRSFGTALHDVMAHTKKEYNFDRGTASQRRDSEAPVRSSELTQRAVLDDMQREANVGGIKITKPRDAKYLQIFSNTEEDVRRIGNQDSVAGDDIIYGHATNIDALENSPLESMIRYQKSADGTTLETEIYSIKKVPAPDLGERYIVSLRNNIDGSTQEFQFDNLDNARNVARLSIGNYAAIRIPAIYESRNDLQQALAANLPSADLPNQKTTRDNAKAITTTNVKLPGGVDGVLTITVKKGKHPAWRRGVPDGDNMYVYATADITGPDGKSYVKYEIVRTGVQSWGMRHEISHQLTGVRNSHLRGNLDLYETRYTGKNGKVNAL